LLNISEKIALEPTLIKVNRYFPIDKRNAFTYLLVPKASSK